MHFAYIEDEAEEEERQQKKTRKNWMQYGGNKAAQEKCKLFKMYVNIWTLLWPLCDLLLLLLLLSSSYSNACTLYACVSLCVCVSFSLFLLWNIEAPVCVIVYSIQSKCKIHHFFPVVSFSISHLPNDFVVDARGSFSSWYLDCRNDETFTGPIPQS